MSDVDEDEVEPVDRCRDITNGVERLVVLVRRSSVCQPCSGVTRICCEEGQSLKLCHGALTVDFGAGCSSCLMTNSFLTNAVGLY